MNNEVNLPQHVGVVAKRQHVAAETMVAHEGDDNTLSGQTGQGVQTSENEHHLAILDFISAKFELPSCETLHFYSYSWSRYFSLLLCYM